MTTNFQNEEEFLDFLRLHSQDKLVEMLTGLEKYTIRLIECKQNGSQNVDWDKEVQKATRVMCRIKDVILEKQNTK
jgi:hypothetical protein